MFVLVEAIAKCVCSEEKELCRIGEVALQVVLETATTLMGSIDKVSIQHIKYPSNFSAKCDFCMVLLAFKLDENPKEVIQVCRKGQPRAISSHIFTYLCQTSYALH